MSALSKLTLTELKLFLRDPASAFFTVGLPTLLLVVLGSVPALREPSQEFGGQRFIDVFAPSLAVVALVMLAFQTLPTYLGAYREKGVLRRLSATPVHPVKLLIAQLVVYLTVAMVATAVLVAVGALAFGIALPQHVLGFAAALILGTSAVFALGIVAGATLPTARSASGVGGLLFMVTMFFGGVYLPRFMLPDFLVRVGDFTPPGVRAIQDAWMGSGPRPLHLAVMAAVVVVAGAVATRWFRWE